MTEFSSHYHQVLELRDELKYARDDVNNPLDLSDAEIGKGRNQEKHQMLMVDKTTSFNKRAKGRRGTSRRTASKLLLK